MIRPLGKRKPSSSTGAWLTLENACGGRVPFAEALGVASATIWKWNRGLTHPNPKSLKAIRWLAMVWGVEPPI